ncbi:MAG: copper resistance CopC family protein [Candidatus Adlerbacteria bacterium]
MRRYIFIALLALVPICASAHATPTQTTPEPSAVVEAAPAEVVVHFSEHVDPHASAIVVTGPAGEVVSQEAARIARDDARVLSVLVKNDGVGRYLVSWSAVSADDGHFTKGAYAFVVGKGQSAGTANSSTVEVVDVSATPEAVFSALELMGDGVIWGALLLFIFCIRPLLRTARFTDERRTVEKYYKNFLYVGVAFGLIGGLLQLVVKAGELATLTSVPFATAFPLYVGTVAGMATMYRVAAVAAVCILFVYAKKKICNSPVCTWQEGALLALMCVFAYWRAVISHVAANPFHTSFSIVVNFFQVIEKDLWFGILLFLCVFAVSARLRSFLMELLPRAFVLLGINFVALSLTSSYLVWLHLKSFENIFTMQWGSVFIQLITAAMLVVCFRAYHVCARLWRGELFARYMPLTFAAELACALLVIYFSALATVTPPPFVQPHTPVYSATDQRLTLALQKDIYEDGMLLLTEKGGHASLGTPTLTVEDTNTSTGPQSVELAKRWEGGYVFPELLLTGVGSFAVDIVAPQTGAYDAHAAFTIPKNAFDSPPGWESARTFDFFTVCMILIALVAGAFALVLLYFSARESVPVLLVGRYSFRQAAGGFALVFCAGLVLTVGIAATGSTNPFKAQCESDGNLWHVMLPTRAGVSLAMQPTEGCMWGMGNFMYLFPDQREYDYVRALGPAVVQLQTTPARLVAGVPAKLNVTLKNADGTPATLFVDMDKLLHMVIVSKDQTEFAHIHADDHVPLTDTEIKNSSFNFAYTFKKAGDYLVSVDYAHGLTLESKQFTVTVAGTPAQQAQPKTYRASGTFGGYGVSLKYALPIAGEVVTLQYTITKDGVPVTNLEQYLSAAMHISVIKNDFSNFLHLHGELHPPGVPLPPIVVKNGQVTHSMKAMMNVPAQFGPTVEAHLIFPTQGAYTVWGEFKVGGAVVPTAFTVKVE